MITFEFELNWKLVIEQIIVALIQNYLHKIALNFCLNSTNTIELSFPGITRIKFTYYLQKNQSNPFSISNSFYLLKDESNFVFIQINLQLMSLKSAFSLHQIIIFFKTIHIKGIQFMI